MPCTRISYFCGDRSPFGTMQTKQIQCTPYPGVHHTPPMFARLFASIESTYYNVCMHQDWAGIGSRYGH